MKIKLQVETDRLFQIVLFGIPFFPNDKFIDNYIIFGSVNKNYKPFHVVTYVQKMKRKEDICKMVCCFANIIRMEIPLRV